MRVSGSNFRSLKAFRVYIILKKKENDEEDGDISKTSS